MFGVKECHCKCRRGIKVESWEGLRESLGNAEDVNGIQWLWEKCWVWLRSHMECIARGLRAVVCCKVCVGQRHYIHRLRLPGQAAGKNCIVVILGLATAESLQLRLGQLLVNLYTSTKNWFLWPFLPLCTRSLWFWGARGWNVVHNTGWSYGGEDKRRKIEIFQN